MGDVLRIATPEDYQEIFRICCLLHAENGQHAFSERKVTELIWRGCNQDRAIIGVIGESNDIKAMLFLVIDPVYYSEDLQLTELWNYVRPDARRSDFARQMIQFAKRCSDETELDLTIGIISDKNLEKKANLYGRLLPKGGTFFIYRPKKSEAAAA